MLKQKSKSKSNKTPRPAISDKTDRKHRVQRHDRSALVQSIADAVVLKSEDIFFLCEPNGQIPRQANHGLGLYYHDCRFLNCYEFHVAGVQLPGLIAAAASGFEADVQLTNPDIHLDSGELLQKEDLGVRMERVIDAARNTYYDRITFQNYKLEAIAFPFSLHFGAAFEDIFEVRGMQAKNRGKLHKPQWKDGSLLFRYDGSDGLIRSLSIDCFPPPATVEGETGHFQVRLGARERQSFLVCLVLAESSQPEATEHQTESPPEFPTVVQSLEHDCEQWLEAHAEVHSDSLVLNTELNRSLRDLRVLRSSIHDETYFAAGVPWYVTLFGRDSLIASLQTLAYEPGVAAHTLRLLAKYQGTRIDDERDEEPGKIMHELRVGELARTNAIPQTPYYGTIDATPLFLVLLCQHAAWTGSLTLFQELRTPVEKSLQWMADYGEPTNSGYLAYQVKAKKGLGNQGWKDSGDSIVNADGSLAKPPIALAEVQGYMYLAKVGLADLFRRTGDTARATQLQHEADGLRTRFNRDFWLEEQGIYALALQADQTPAAVVSSNAGQVLWSGIADPAKAQRTMDRLMADDMFNGWGIRTLSAKERRYNPVGYHLGTVWPHDNALIAAGFRHYGFDDAAGRIVRGIMEAAAHLHNYRLPEVFAGFPREPFGVPVHYPVACHPQAWAAGALPYMAVTMLGLIPEAFERRLRVVRPTLPDFVHCLELRRLQVGSARTDLRFRRVDHGRVDVAVLNVSGPLDVVVEPQGQADQDQATNRPNPEQRQP